MDTVQQSQKSLAVSSQPPTPDVRRDQRLRDGEIFDRYLTLCGDLVARGWFSTPVRFIAGAGPDTIEHGGEDLLRSTMMTFRQLFEKNEETEFGRVCKKAERISHRNDHFDLRTRAKEAKTRYQERLDDGRLILIANPAEPFDSEGRREIPARNVIDDWLYSGHFHWDEDKRRRVQFWGQPAYELQLIKSLNACFRSYLELADIVATLCTRVDLGFTPTAGPPSRATATGPSI